MSRITVDDAIITEEVQSINTDEHPRPEKGEKGTDGTDGRDGKDGIDGKDGRDGIDGKDGINGTDGKDGIDGRDGKDAKPAKNGKDGIDGKDGKDGLNGEDGTQWFIFETQVDDKKGVEGDLALVKSSSHFYQKKKTSAGLIWKWIGNLRGEKGDKGDAGTNGTGGGGSGGGFISHIYKRGVILHMFNTILIPAKGNANVLVAPIPVNKAADLLKVDLSGENIGEFVYGIQSDMGDAGTFVQLGIKRTNFTKYNEQVFLERKQAQGPTNFVVKAVNPRPLNANFDATVYYDLYDSVVI